MMNKMKEYMDGSMEPEVDNTPPNRETDLSIASKTFNTLGIIAIAVSLILFPVIGFQITILLFGILFIGMSILMKYQDEIIRKLDGTISSDSQICDDSLKQEE